MSRELLTQFQFNRQRLEDVVLSLQTRVAVESETSKYREYIHDLLVYVGQIGACVLSYEQEVKYDEAWQIFMKGQEDG